MKINDKLLAAYACSRDSVDKEGYLNKKGEVNRGYQRRWFVLKGNLLFYFEKQGDKQPLGLIVLEDCSVEVCDVDRYSFNISFGDNTRTYVLCAENEYDLESWMKIVTFAPYNYSDMIVRELDKKLARLKENELRMTKEVSGKSNDKTDNYDNVELIDESLLEAAAELPDSNPKRIPIEDKAKKTRHSKKQDRHTVGTPNHFPDLLSVASALNAGQKIRKTLPSGLVRRSKSSENLHKLGDKSPSRSPVPLRRRIKNHQSTIRRNVLSNKSLDQSSSQPSANVELLNKLDWPLYSTFESLHNQYAAAIWTRVKDYETTQPLAS